MRTHTHTLFTMTEAAVLTRTPLKTVNNIIDRKIVPVCMEEPSGRTGRLLDSRALFLLALERWFADRLTPESRREMFAGLPGASRDRIVLGDGLLTVDLREPRRELAASLRDLRRVRALIHSDPGIMGGDPVFRGTRVPVHMVAEILTKGETVESLAGGYPTLTTEMIRLAPLYAAAYPLMGRPRAQPWDRPPIRVVRRPWRKQEVA